MIDRDQDTYRPLSDVDGNASEDPAGAGSSNWFASDPFDNHFAALARTIESEVIPRLLLAHRLDTRPPAGGPNSTTEEATPFVTDFSLRVRAHGTAALTIYIQTLLTQGMTLNAVLLDLLAPTARYLGHLWCEDECSFVEVTLALCKLQSLLHDLGDTHNELIASNKAAHPVLLAAVPGNQHSFGIYMVEGFFRRAGWNVRTLGGPTESEIVDAVRRNSFAVVGLSVSCDVCAPVVAPLIAKLRKVSRNRSLTILAGGPYFKDNPELAIALGADATAPDAPRAVAQTERVIKATERN